ncbi:phage terminase large subunit domain protein [Moraxella catarrhalis]|uniref:Phage terminase large subunit domain protein n=1 Tax=Moraxella catarrhalis TaxID=480 RepID=A0A3S9QEI2_MORCA|nr:phage terminase large subunit domain protein [Moraxella catarrhalis]
MTTEPISERLQAYFDSLKAKHGIQLSDEQKAWYQAKERTLGDDMKREYPSLHLRLLSRVLKVRIMPSNLPTYMLQSH